MRKVKEREERLRRVKERKERERREIEEGGGERERGYSYPTSRLP